MVDPGVCVCGGGAMHAPRPLHPPGCLSCADPPLSSVEPCVGQRPQRQAPATTLLTPSLHLLPTPPHPFSLSSPPGTARFATVVNDDRVAELEMLRDFLKNAVQAFDAQAAALAAPAARMRKLLTAKDKRATLLEMAGANEIDKELIALLDQNAKAAKDAGQEEAAEFLGKVRDAARKFLLTV